MALSRPGAAQVERIVGRIGKINRGAECLLKPERRLPVMLKPDRAGDGAVVSKDCIQQLNGQAGIVVIKGKLQRLRLVILFCIDCRQPFKCRFSGSNSVARVFKFGGPGAVSQQNLIGRPSEIARPVLRVLLRQSIQREGRIRQQRDWRERGPFAKLQHASQAVVVPEACAPVYMGRVAFNQLYDIAGIFRLKMKQA
ncbi:hypothetical protein D3C73_608010 [compost metagenome]